MVMHSNMQMRSKFALMAFNFTEWLQLHSSDLFMWFILKYTVWEVWFILILTWNFCHSNINIRIYILKHNKHDVLMSLLKNIGTSIYCLPLFTKDLTTVEILPCSFRHSVMFNGLLTYKLDHSAVYGRINHCHA